MTITTIESSIIHSQALEASMVDHSGHLHPASTTSAPYPCGLEKDFTVLIAGFRSRERLHLNSSFR